MKKALLALVCGAGLIVLFLFGANIYRQAQFNKYGFMSKENAEVFVRPHSQTLGSEDAKVYLIEFTDPACETCAVFHPLVKKIMEAHPGQIKLVLRYAPFHEGADYVVRILEASKKQDKYWETLDLMFRTQAQWAIHHVAQPDKIWPLLPQVGLDVDKLKQDMQDPEIQRVIDQDMADVKALNVRKTPGFFVNGKPLVNFGLENLRDLILSEIVEVY